VRAGHLALLLAIFGLVLFGTLGLRPLYKADESRYAEIPREMVASGDWLTPRLNGLKYFEKPPLQYWATAAFFKLAGESDAAARLWTALACFGGVVMVWLAGNRLFSPPAGLLAAMVLAGSPLYVLLGEINTLDMALAFFLSAAIFSFALGRYYLFWAACALAVLSKGLIGIVLPLATIGLYVLLKWDWALLRKMKIPGGGALFLAICAPWFIAVSAANPEFAHFFFVQEHFQRFTTKMHGRYQPFWYFLPILAFGIGPWLLPFFASFAKVFRKDPAGGFDAALFLALWALVVFAFFSASDSKLPSYILPIFPPLAVLIGRWIALAQPRRLLAAQAVLTAAFGAALAAAAAFMVEKAGVRPDLGAVYVPWLAGAGLLLAAAALAAAVSAWRGRIVPAVALLALGGCGCVLTALTGHRVLAPLYSVASQAGQVQGNAPVFAVDFYDHTLPWYFRRTVTMVRYKDELAEAIQWEQPNFREPHKFIPDLAGFARAWTQAPAAYAVFSSSGFESLKKEINVPMEIVSQGPRYIIVRKP
jgi:4-amino-4-deoxy-L-arabinose transferase-like glycosyltransferase